MINRFIGLIIIVVIVGSIVGLIKVNKWIQGEVSEIVKTPEIETGESPTPVQIKETPKPKKRTGEVIRKTRLAPERTFEHSIFYQGGEEIARHKVSRKGLVYDQTGKIPNGKVKFINETNRTYGVEYYIGNMKNGPARTNYKDGQLKIEANYQFGELITRKEYYIDGVLKMEEDYSDARKFDDARETGTGKVYYRDGMVKFEWYLVNSDPVGYHKSYNVKGKLTLAVYFDEFGNEKPREQSVTVTSAAPSTGIFPQ